MQEARTYALYFIQEGIDTSPNTFDGNMKIQKMLVFADLIHLAEYEKPLFDDEILAFKNGCVVESVRLEYRNHYSDLKIASVTEPLFFSEEEEHTLNLTVQLFGQLTAVELSDLNHQFLFWSEAYKKGVSDSGYHIKQNSVVCVSEMQAEIDKVRQMIEAYKENSVAHREYELVNGITFYYEPGEVDITDALLDELENYSMQAEDKTYSIYYDDGKLVIY